MQTLGEKLKAARERKRITASQAAAATRIKIQHIEAMEANQFDRIPAPTYVKGFLKMYAEHLGLEPAPLIREYVEQHMPRARPSLMTGDDAPPRKPAPADARPPTAAAPARAPRVQKAIEPAEAPAAAPAAPKPRRPPVDWAKQVAWARAAARQALVRVPWKYVGAVVAVAVVLWALIALVQAVGKARAAAPIARAAPAPGVPATIAEPPEPYLEARPIAGTRP